MDLMAHFTMRTGGHYITMLPAHWLISTSQDPLPSSCHKWKDAMEYVYWPAPKLAVNCKIKQWKAKSFNKVVYQIGHRYRQIFYQLVACFTHGRLVLRLLCFFPCLYLSIYLSTSALIACAIIMSRTLLPCDLTWVDFSSLDCCFVQLLGVVQRQCEAGREWSH